MEHSPVDDDVIADIDQQLFDDFDFVADGLQGPVEEVQRLRKTKGDWLACRAVG